MKSKYEKDGVLAASYELVLGTCFTSESIGKSMIMSNFELI